MANKILWDIDEERHFVLCIFSVGVPMNDSPNRWRSRFSGKPKNYNREALSVHVLTLIQKVRALDGLNICQSLQSNVGSL